LIPVRLPRGNLARDLTKSASPNPLPGNTFGATGSGTRLAGILTRMVHYIIRRSGRVLWGCCVLVALVSPLAAQTIASASNQTFVVGDPATPISNITVTDAATPQIQVGNDIRILIPAAFNMTWNTAITTATITGTGAGKVSTTVTYEDASKTLVVHVTANFTGGQAIKISGLQFTNFTATSATNRLGVNAQGLGNPATAFDSKTITIVAPTLTGAANQAFTVGDPATAMTSVTITDAGRATITAANDLRLRIPAGFNMTWNTALTTATIGGGAAGKVSTTVSYENGGQVLVLNVTSDFAASDQITVSGLQFNNFTAVSAAAALELVVSGSAGGGTAAPSSTTKQIVQPRISSAANQTFVVAQAATAMRTITVTDNATVATITAANDIRIRIPASFNMTWNTALTTATIGGGSAAKVSTTVTYEDGGKTLVLNVTSNFTRSNQIRVSGLQFANFTAASAAANLQLVVSGTGGGTAATDNRTITIAAPTIASAANQTFVVAQAATAISTITVTDGSSSAITAANAIRIRIPTGFNMTWNTALTTATIGGAAAAKVSSTVSYENAGQVLVLNVTSNFAAGDQITVAGLQFNNFTAVSAADFLQLVVSGAGGATNALDSKTVTIVAPTLVGAANQTFVVGDPATAMTSVTITDASTATITAANDIRIRIPTGFNMTWNTALTTATTGGAAAAKVSTTVSYENAGQVLVLNVTANFAAGDQITVSGLQFTSFTGVSAADFLQLVVSGSAGGGTAALSSTTKQIVAPTLTGAASQTFVVGDPATAMTTNTVTDNATAATITAANDIRIRIPTGFNMTWNTALTTATLGGAAAAKVSTTVSYENSGQVLVLNVTANFAAGDQITVSGLQFNNFTAVSAAAALQLVVSGSAGGGTAATSNMTKQIVAPTFTGAANQTFTVGDPATAMTGVTITDASTATITAANDIRIRIPSGFNMTWNTVLTTATIGGAAAAKVSTTVSYENSGQVLVLNVTSNFAAGDQITVSGLQFTSFTAVAAANNLQLVVSGSAGGGTAALSSTTKQIVQPTLSSAANRRFAVGDPATAMGTATVTDNATAATITAVNDIRIRIPAGFNMTWNTALTTAMIGGGAAAKVSTTVTYENGGQVLVLNVTANFAVGDQITVSGLQFTNFTAVSPAANLQLVVSGSAGGGTAASDDKTVTIQTVGVAVSPHTTTASRLPSNGTNYTVAFTVQNTGAVTDSCDLLITKQPGTVLTTVSIVGTGITQGGNPDSARLSNLSAGGSVTATVTYAVGSAALGATDTLTFKARSITSPAHTDNGRMTVTVARPSLTVSKGVSPSGTQPLGTDLTYTTTVTNGGTSNANSVVLVDSLGSTVQFKMGSVTNGLPVSVVVEYSNNGGSTWTYTPASGACGAPAGYDRCVNRVRWTLQSALSFTGPNNTGTVQLIARIR
jgi:uncharacterized repeat protein (TIGR01451 family)